MTQLTADRLEFLIATIGQLVDGTDGDPVRRCLARRTIDREIATLRKTPEARWLRYVTSAELYRSLEEADLLAPIASVPPSAPADQLFAAGLGADPDRLDPLELLAALEPDGVACHFTALTIHGLTTQFAPHHHIARPVVREIAASKVTIPAGNSTPPLGRWRYAAMGLTFYSTDRTAQLMPGMETRHLSEHLRMRCTTIEQTLIDGLMHPYACGGEAVVFEAWERMQRVGSPEELIRLATTIPHEGLRRRTGHMLEQFVGADIMATATFHALRGRSTTPIPLLQGFPYQRIEPRWQLMVP